MSTAPYGVRLVVGAATVAVEETMRLPQTIMMYPMTLASQAAHMVMLWQQGLAELAIRGDSTLDTWFPPKDEQPEWATFDEDLGDAVDATDVQIDTDSEPPGAGRRTEGRFALYTSGDDNGDATGKTTGKLAETKITSASPAPDVVDALNYGTLTLAQLRARLQSLSVEELEALLAYEEATKARAPFQTLLANRITRASTK